MSTTQKPGARFEARSPNVPLRRHAISHVETYEVTAQELRSIEKESADVGLAFHFALNTFSIGATLIISLLLTEKVSTTVHASFVAIAIAMGVLSLYFFISYFRARRTTRSTIQEIRERQVEPLGEEGHEILPSELAQLRSEPENPEEAGEPEPEQRS